MRLQLQVGGADAIQGGLLGDQLVILLRETPDGQALERSQNDFRRVLEQGRANTVDSAEQA
ncbi:KinB sensor domain-containing domain, partial [Escherichia coli]|uniref:KinB sensor domain-containing domain n=1 Tax=Escherichia coli TaxID=562 RepID=UPI0039775EBC